MKSNRIIDNLYLALTEPIDVYSEWIDECEKANQAK
jgi:transcription elongation factor Elf1